MVVTIDSEVGVRYPWVCYNPGTTTTRETNLAREPDTADRRGESGVIWLDEMGKR